MGGYIAANRAIIDAVRSYAPEFIFTTALPPASVRCGARLDRAPQGQFGWEREQQQRQAQLTKEILAEAGLPVMPTRPISCR
jgi:5-aminolevulinate synthase